MIKKPKKEEPVEEWKPRDHLVSITHPGLPTFRKASSVLFKINGGFQRFVAATEDGKFVPVVMLMPTEFTPDIVNHCERLGAYVMVGVANVRDQVRFP